MKLNFYLMGKSEIDQETILEIGDNMNYFNEEFEGSVKFELNKLFLEEKHEYLPNIYKDYKRKSRSNVNELIKDIEETGAINIYLLETYSAENSNKSLMGFTQNALSIPSSSSLDPIRKFPVTGWSRPEIKTTESVLQNL